MSNETEYQTGFWEIEDRKRCRIHIVRDERPICGDRIHSKAKYRWIGHGVLDEYIECRRCKEIIQRRRMKGANMTVFIKNAKQLEHKARSHQVTQVGDLTFEVVSGTSGTKYKVALLGSGGAICSCGWGVHRSRYHNHRSACSHTQAVYDYLANLIGRKSYAWTSKEAAARQHRPATNIQDGVVLTSRKEGT